MRVGNQRRTFEPLSINDGTRDYTIVVLPLGLPEGFEVGCERYNGCYGEESEKGQNDLEVGQNKEVIARITCPQQLL